MSDRNNKIFLGLALFAIALLFFVGQWTPQSEKREQRTVVFPDQSTLVVELSETPAQRMQGLSDRRSLPANEGMMFVFSETDLHRFWMKDMHFALDFIWLRGSEIVELRSDVFPPSQMNGSVLNVLPTQAFDRVIEVNAGFILDRQLKVGDRLSY